MRLYDFHGSVPLNEVGKELRSIVRRNRADFKVLTGYGSHNGICRSKESAMKSLRKMRILDLIKVVLPA